MSINHPTNRQAQSFLALKLFLNEYYAIYGPADETLPSLLSNLGRADADNYMPLDSALWQMWCTSLEKAEQALKEG
jgi:hypothetical protein